MVSKSQTEMRTELEKEGWTRQFTVDEPRLSEAIEMYKLLGFEVHLEPMVPDENSEECAACLEVMCDRHYSGNSLKGVRDERVAQQSIVRPL